MLIGQYSHQAVACPASCSTARLFHCPAALPGCRKVDQLHYHNNHDSTQSKLFAVLAIHSYSTPLRLSNNNGFQDMSRPTSQHRSSISSIPSSLPTRNSYSRSHSNSLSLNSYNPTHRVTRRKSTTLNNNAALSAAIQAAAEGDDEGARIAHRRSIPSKSSIGPSSLPHHISAPDALQYAKNRTNNGSAVVDGPSLSKDSMKPRMRRSSEGGALLKKKSGTGDLKCDTCGKGYKHSSCLTKHLSVSPWHPH